MPCYKPITAYRSRSGRSDGGGWPIVFDPRDGYRDLRVTIPCGRCIGCKLEYSRQWAIRIVNEAQMHKSSCFATLTYNDEHLDKNKSLNKRDFPLFMKRLRNENGPGVRYYQSAEYGSESGRPHHHACIFGYRPDDAMVHTVNGRGNRLYTSEQLSRYWRDENGDSLGFTSFGDVDFESAAYCARYVIDKISGDKKEEHYAGRIPEYSTMSRRPGIGRTFMDKYVNDMYNNDMQVLRSGKICKPARYYDKIYESEHPEEMAVIKGRRKKERPELDIEERYNLVREGQVKGLQIKKFLKKKGV